MPLSARVRSAALPIFRSWHIVYRTASGDAVTIQLTWSTLKRVRRLPPDPRRRCLLLGAFAILIRIEG